MINKAIIRRFNSEVIEQCNRDAFETLVAQGFVNHTAAPGQPDDREGLWHIFHSVLHRGLSDLRVAVLDQIAEHDKVTTRKRITGVHSDEFLGVAVTGRSVCIDVRIEHGQYVEHWGLNSLATVLTALRAP